MVVYEFLGYLFLTGIVYFCVTGTIRFSFKIHQFAGGFTEACSTKFAEVSAKTRALTKRDLGEEGAKRTEQAVES